MNDHRGATVWRAGYPAGLPPETLAELEALRLRSLAGEPVDAVLSCLGTDGRRKRIVVLADEAEAARLAARFAGDVSHEPAS